VGSPFAFCHLSCISRPFPITVDVNGNRAILVPEKDVTFDALLCPQCHAHPPFLNSSCVVVRTVTNFMTMYFVSVSWSLGGP
jgi:hypothetical protein